jgi:hypothetical protein
MAALVRRLAVAGFHALWNGEAPELGSLAPGAEERAVVEAVEHLERAGRLEVGPDGRLVAIHGLTRRPTRHWIRHRTRQVNTWCALDALGIPAALDLDAQAKTDCPTCRAELTIVLRQGIPDGGTGAVLWFPTARGHLLDNFCSRANLFCRQDHLEAWVATSAGEGRRMEPSEAATLGRELWADVRGR